ncbi:MAG: TetR/AcrR family transcriptional regulator [Nitrospirota bacterium]
MNKRSGIESRKKIIQAAMEVFSRRGYAQANIRDIAGKAGLSVGGVYLYFKNKEELYKSLIHDRMDEIGGKVSLAIEHSVSAPEALGRFLRLHMENALRHREFILLHIREHGFAFGRKEKRDFFRGQKRLVESIIKKGIDTGEFRKCDAKKMSDMVMGSLRGIVLAMALDGDEVEPEALSDFMLRGILKRERGTDI